jgi:hypothetical protein
MQKGKNYVKEKQERQKDQVTLQTENRKRLVHFHESGGHSDDGSPQFYDRRSDGDHYSSPQRSRLFTLCREVV